MSVAAQRVYHNAENWKSTFLSFVSNRLDEIENTSAMESITDITKSLFENRSAIMGQAVLALIEKKFAHLLDQSLCPCPQCHRRVKAHGEKVRREIDTVVGPVTLYRPYFYCRHCAFGFYPLDDALGLCHRKVQPDIQQLEAWLAAEMPYETVGEALKRCAGIDLSNHHVHDVVNDIAADIELLDVCPDRTRIHRKIEQLSKGKFRRPVLMIGIDGAHAPTRPEPSARKGKRGKGQWREVKGFRMYLLDDKKLVHLISWHQIQSDKALANDLLQIKQAGLIPSDKVRIAVVGDGAQWIWNRIQETYPDAKKVLDYFHCSQYLHDLASAQYGNNSQKAREWVEATLTRLFMNNADHIIAGMKRMKPRTADAKEQIEKTIKYLSERKDKINYRSLKRGGFHIGSGGIESSNKFIANVRLKRSGAWWYPSNANNILKLRCAKYNQTFDQVMKKRKFRINRPLAGEGRSRLHLIVDNS